MMDTQKKIDNFLDNVLPVIRYVERGKGSTSTYPVLKSTITDRIDQRLDAINEYHKNPMAIINKKGEEYKGKDITISRDEVLHWIWSNIENDDTLFGVLNNYDNGNILFQPFEKAIEGDLLYLFFRKMYNDLNSRKMLLDIANKREGIEVTSETTATNKK